MSADCICEDVRGCVGDPGVATDCQPCLELHPADQCLRYATSSQSPTSDTTQETR